MRPCEKRRVTTHVHTGATLATENMVREQAGLHWTRTRVPWADQIHGFNRGVFPIVVKSQLCGSRRTESMTVHSGHTLHKLLSSRAEAQGALWNTGRCVTAPAPALKF